MQVIFRCLSFLCSATGIFPPQPAEVTVCNRSFVFPRAGRCARPSRIGLSFFALAIFCAGAWAQSGNFIQTEITIGSGWSQPQGVAVDANGNVYVADDAFSYVVKEALANNTFTQSTAGNAFNEPLGVAADTNGNLYVTDSQNNKVWKLTYANGLYTQSAIAETGLNAPWGIAVDSSFNVYVADSGNNRVIKLSPGVDNTWVQSVITASILNKPEGVAVDSNGNVYIADSGNNRVVIDTPESSSYSQSATEFDSLKDPDGVAVDSNGDVFISDAGDSLIYKETNEGDSYSQSFVLTSNLSSPGGVAVDAKGNIYITDPGHSRVLEETSATGNFGQVAVGSTSNPLLLQFKFQTDGYMGAPVVVTEGAVGKDFVDTGTGTCSSDTGQLWNAPGTCQMIVTFTPSIAGARSGAILLKSTTGAVIGTAWLTGTGMGPLANFPPGINSKAAALDSPFGVTVDGQGNVYASDTGADEDGMQGIYKETPSAGGYTQTKLSFPNIEDGFGLAVDPAGALVVADYDGGKIFRELPTSSGYAETVVATGLNGPYAVAADGQGNLYAVTSDNRLYEFTWNATEYVQSVINTSALSTPRGVAVDAAGNIYIADSLNDRVLKETLGSDFTYTESVIASGTDSFGTTLVAPTGVAVDPRGVVYFGDRNGNTYKETPSSNSYVQSIVVPSISTNNIAADAGGNLYIAGFENSAVTKADFADAPVLAFASTNVGATSSDSPKPVTVANVGDANFNWEVFKVGSNPSVPANFDLVSGATECPIVKYPSNPSPLEPGESCTVYISFEPTQPGTVTGSAVLNFQNPLNNAVIDVDIPVSGTAQRATPLIKWSTPAPGTYPAVLGSAQLNATATVSGITVAGTFAYSPVSGTRLAAGSHTLSVTFTPTNQTDYTTASGSVTFVVDKAVLTVIGDSAERTYGGADPHFSYTYDGFVNGDTAATALHGGPALSTTADKYYPWGDYDIDVSVGTLSAANYSFFFVPGTLFIEKAPLTITANNASVDVDKAPPKFTWTATGFVNGETTAVLTGAPVETTTAHIGSPIGTYPIDIMQGTLTAENYAFTFVDGTLTIKSATAATPVFQRSETADSTAQKVTLTDATHGATIYYTTSGEKPTSASKKYTVPIAVDKTETIKAIAIAKGYAESAVAEATCRVP